ncbi:MAG: hypothetical protein ABL918_10215 [Chakrabartia sp.]
MESISLLDPDRNLALAYAKARNRTLYKALFLLDERLGSCVALARDPMLAQIRLAWWRDALLGLHKQNPDRDPLLSTLKNLSADGGFDVTSLAAMVDGWEYLLEELPLLDDHLVRFAQLRGGHLFSLLSGCDDPYVRDAAQLWALMDVSRRLRCDVTVRRALALASSLSAQGLALRFEARHRPLAILTRFAERDSQGEPTKAGSPRRIIQAFGLILRRG